MKNKVCNNYYLNISKNMTFKNIIKLLKQSAFYEHLLFHNKLNNACVICSGYERIENFNKSNMVFTTNLYNHINVIPQGSIFSISIQTLECYKKSNEQNYLPVWTSQYFRRVLNDIKGTYRDKYSYIDAWIRNNTQFNNYEIIDLTNNSIEVCVNLIQNKYYETSDNVILVLLIEKEELVLWNVIIQTIINDIRIICFDKKSFMKQNTNPFIG